MTENRDIRIRLIRIGNIPAFSQHIGVEVMEAAEEIKKLRSALKICRQALLEVNHAQECGANWYTRGEAGLYRQVRMWVHKGFDAIKTVEIPENAP